MEPQTIECPTCGADARFLYCEQCENCAEGEIATSIERLKPDDGE